MSTRKRSSFLDPNSPLKSDLPPSRKGKATAKDKTTLPFANVRFNTFIYVLSALAFAFIAFNVWRLLHMKTAAGGWWNLALRRRPHDVGDGYDASTTDKGRGGSVEDHINSLADALGIPSHELASAIADAVRRHDPHASSSSLSATEALQSDTATGIIGGEEDEAQTGTVMGDMLNAFAGFDDPDMD